jgi:hypothetical protein
MRLVNLVTVTKNDECCQEIGGCSNQRNIVFNDVIGDVRTPAIVA